MKMTQQVHAQLLMNLEQEVEQAVRKHIERKYPNRKSAWHEKWAAKALKTLLEPAHKDIDSKVEADLPFTWDERTEAIQEFWGKWGVSEALTDSMLLLLWHQV